MARPVQMRQTEMYEETGMMTGGRDDAHLLESITWNGKDAIPEVDGGQRRLRELLAHGVTCAVLTWIMSGPGNKRKRRGRVGPC